MLMSIKRKRSPGLSGQSLPQQVSRNQEKNTIDRIYWMSILYVECVKHYHTLYSVYEGALSEPNREGGVNPPRSRRCKGRGQGIRHWGQPREGAFVR
ncbi:hypothetical protein TRIP_E220097 [uncultured Spirochaetota bacterium]|uniref:Uncharacterized protein n=1 Tax=uncultured Spirochaetota bacterium TaxID=460511 RepID=A0A652ZVI4_9SPIR|nr:hypothetical protein TRIP_E220097 [uncultured Spirochaetota bacterium]